MGNTPCSMLSFFSMQDCFYFHEKLTKFTTTEELTAHLIDKARTPLMRLPSVPQGSRRKPANIGPVIPFLQQGLIDCVPGITYVLPMNSFMGKTMAAKYVIAKLNDRNALYLNVAGAPEMVNTLKATLKTTVDSDLLPQCLVDALGSTEVVGDYNLAPLLIIDEVNEASGDNKAFIQALFLAINCDKGLTCVILTNREEVAEALIALNQGKIRPFPGSAAEPWKPPIRPEWLRDVHWTRDELMKLIRYKSRTRLGDRVENVFSKQFPADGEAPGEVRVVVDLMIATGEIN